MIQNEIAYPKVVGRDEWLTASKTLLDHEKALTQQRDRINAERRRLPMVKLEKEYTFEGSNGSGLPTDDKKTLKIHRLGGHNNRPTDRVALCNRF